MWKFIFHNIHAIFLEELIIKFKKKRNLLRYCHGISSSILLLNNLMDQARCISINTRIIFRHFYGVLWIVTPYLFEKQTLKSVDVVDLCILLNCVCLETPSHSFAISWSGCRIGMFANVFCDQQQKWV